MNKGKHTLKPTYETSETKHTEKARRQTTAQIREKDPIPEQSHTRKDKDTTTQEVANHKEATTAEVTQATQETNNQKQQNSQRKPPKTETEAEAENNRCQGKAHTIERETKPRRNNDNRRSPKSDA